MAKNLSNNLSYSTGSNGTAPPPGEDPMPIWLKISLGCLIGIIILITLTGNILVVATFLRSHNFKRFTKSLVISLALADGLVALVVMPYGLGLLASDDHWSLGHVACLVFTCFDVMFTTTSIFHLSCLALDRYLAVCKPFLYQRKVNTKFIVIALLISWVVPATISFVPILNEWNTMGIEHQLPKGETCIFLVNIPFALICSAIAFYGPMVFMLICNILIFKVARRQAIQIRRASIASEMQDSVGSRKYIHGEAKAAKTLSIIMGCFFICWFPFFLFNVIDVFIGYKIPKVPWMIAVWLGYINSLMNPFLYYFFNRKFREALLIMLKIRTKQDFASDGAAFLTDNTKLRMQQLYLKHTGLNPDSLMPCSRRNSTRPSVSFSCVSDKTSDPCPDLSSQAGSERSPSPSGD